MLKRRNKMLAYLTAFTMAVSIMPSTALAADSFSGSGKGTLSDPYIITNETQLEEMKNNLSAYYKLGNDIVLKDNWTPIGTATLKEMDDQNCPDAFNGTLDGNNKTISNLKVDADKISGNGKYTPALFGIFTTGGQIKNLTVKDISVKGNEESMVTGGVVGYGMGGKLENVTLTTSDDSKNTITGTNCVGGLVGGGSGVNNCEVDNTIINIFGDNTKGEDSFSSGRIVQHDVAECGGIIIGGGFGGSITGNKVKNCEINANSETGATEAVGLGGIGGCLQCVTSADKNSVDGLKINAPGGHAIGGIAGYTGNGNMEAYGFGTKTDISDCTVKSLDIEAENATHVGGLIGTNMYYMGMEGKFNVLSGCSVSGKIKAGTDSSSIYGVSVPGAVAGHAAGCDVSGCTFEGLEINGEAAKNAKGIVNVMYESADQDDEKYDQTNAGAQLNGLFGEYQQLFRGATFESKYDSYWYDAAAAVVGKTNAAAAVEAMKSSIGSTKYGSEAEEYAFCCDFTNGIDRITFNGTEISGTKDGKEVFSHPYKCIGVNNIGESEGVEGFGGYTFETLDGNDDEFKYFLLMPDTPGSTYHIEFRYGNSLEDLKKYGSGKYSHWLAAGILTSALNQSSSDKGRNDAMLKQVIGLFTVENVSSMASEETVAQRKDIVGIWDADEACLKALREETGYNKAQMYFELKEDGSGATYVDVNGTGDYVRTLEYTFYNYDNDGDKDKKSGVYLVKNGENVSSAPYEVITKGSVTSLYLYADDGTSSWVKRSTKENNEKVKSAALSKDSYTYDGKVKRPTVIVKNTKGKLLENGKDYTVKFSNKNSKKIGSYTVTIEYKGNYSGKTTLKYTIGPKKTAQINSISSKSKKIIVKWSKNNNASGYQLQLSTDKSFNKNVKTYNISNKKTTSKEIKKLVKGTKYSVRIRTYKKVNDVKCFASWSKIKTVKCK